MSEDVKVYIAIGIGLAFLAGLIAFAVINA